MKYGHILFLVLIALFSKLFAEDIPSNLDALLDVNGRQPQSLERSDRIRRTVQLRRKSRVYHDERKDYYGGYRGGYAYRNGYGEYRRYRNRFGDFVPRSSI